MAQCNETGQTDADGKAYTLETLKAAIEKAGFTLEEHYHKYADSEGTHAYGYMDFDEDYYLQSKLAQLASIGQSGWTKDSLIKAIEKAGMTVEEHFQKYSTLEGTSANPYFNTSEYMAAKLTALQAAEPDAGWTETSMYEAFAKSGLNALAHYMQYAGKGDNEAASDISSYAVPEEEQINIQEEGSETVFTDQMDNLKGTDGNDTFEGVQKATYQTGDKLVDPSTSDEDVLNVTMASAEEQMVTVTNVETINVDAQSVTGSPAFNASKITGVKSTEVNLVATLDGTTDLTFDDFSTWTA
ncbi:MAG: hypothetical protein IKN64_12735 [Desulfovibrio sp.]|nr:hypothetical protein [Desulfovibrio sp.]